MRIIAGVWKGRRIEAPPGNDVRPTSDRLRETLFNVLAPVVPGARVLDAFAGTGAVGLEALSRGAVHVTFVEQDPRVIRVLEANARGCGAASGLWTVLRGDFMRAAGLALRESRFDLVFLDPPYALATLDVLIVLAAGLVEPGGRLVVEHDARRTCPVSAGGLTRTRVLAAGDSALSFYSVTM